MLLETLVAGLITILAVALLALATAKAPAGS